MIDLGLDASGSPLLAGAALYPDDVLVVTIIPKNEGSSLPSEVVVSLEDASGAESARARFVGDASRDADGSAVHADFNASLSPVAIPAGLKPGLYWVNVAAIGADGQRSVKRQPVFVLEKPIAIGSIVVSPASVPPGHPALVVASVNAPGLDPWLVWRSAGRVVHEGSLSAEGGEFLFDPGTTEGIRSITLDLYPVGPSASSFDFSAPYQARASLPVDARAASDLAEFGPREAYASLLHFRGDLADEAAPGGGAAATGSPRPALLERGFGMRFGPGEGFSARATLPSARGGEAAPFGLHMSFALTPMPSPPPEAAFPSERDASDDGSELDSIRFELASDAGMLALVIASDGGLSLEYMAPDGITAISTPLSISRGSGLRELYVGLRPFGSTVWALCALDGQDAAWIELPGLLPPEGMLQCALRVGSHAEPIVISEFGLRLHDQLGRPGLIDDWFSRIARSRSKSSLVVAEGLDGTTLPNGWTVSGKAESRPGALALFATRGEGDDGKAGYAASELSIALPQPPSGKTSYLIELSISGDISKASCSIGSSAFSLSEGLNKIEIDRGSLLELADPALRLRYAGPDSLLIESFALYSR
jgi:hypothetical protein